MLKVIVNADDFGINEIVTRETEKLIEEKKISSATIMANGDCLEEVKRFASIHPEVSFGVHVCLSEFSSITKSTILLKYGIIDNKGFFLRHAVLKLKKINKELSDALYNEISAQLKIVKGLDIPLSHCDSHHHVHTVPILREIFAKVLKDNGFKKVRIPTRFKSVRERLHLMQFFNRSKTINFYKNNFTTVGEFSSYSNFLEYANNSHYEVIELMVHPGHSGINFKNEIELLKNEKLRNILDYKLISYEKI